MGSLIYIRLMGHTAGTLLELFWMVAILGYRRQRNFERVFFSLCVALFLFYSGSLLALNSHLYYPQPPAALNEFAIGIISLGLCLLPAVLLHLHIEYAETRGLLRSKRWKLAVLLVFYAACVHLAVQRIPLLYQDPHFDFLVPGRSLGHGFAIVLASALAWSAGWEGRFAEAAPDKPQRYSTGRCWPFSSCRFWQSPGCTLLRSLLKRERQKRWPQLFRFCPSCRSRC